MPYSVGDSIPGYDSWKLASPYEGEGSGGSDPGDECECTFCGGPHESEDCNDADASVDEHLLED